MLSSRAHKALKADGQHFKKSRTSFITRYYIFLASLARKLLNFIAVSHNDFCR
jgi:hypothetical protein